MSRHRNTAGRIVLLLALATASGAHAELLVRGFGTTSLSCFSADEADYVVNDQPEGAGRSARCDTGLDSLLGVQFDLTLSGKLDFTLQVIADRNTDRGFDPDVNVAQLRWRMTPHTTLRLGRVPTSSFLYAESRQVRYAMPWVRPPLEVYGLVPTFSQDGLEVIHNGKIGGWFAEWHGGAFTLTVDSPVSNSRDTTEINSEGAFLNLTLQNGLSLVKLGYGYNQTTLESDQFDALLSALRTFVVPLGAELADDLQLEDSATHIAYLGFRHEWDDWLLMAEAGYRSIDGFFRDQIGAYVTLGRRFGPWLPYATVARRWTDGPEKDTRAGLLSAEVNALLASSRFDTTSYSLGLSYDLAPQAILKIQVDSVHPDQQSFGLYTNHSADFNFHDPDGEMLFTLSVDFVF